MKKINVIGVMVLLITLVLSGCGAKTTVGSESFSLDTISEISIETEGNPIRIYATDGNEVLVSAPGYKQEWVKSENGRMVVRVPSPAGIHLKAPGQVEIAIPEHSALELSAETESGHVSIEHVLLDRLNVKTSAGNIKLVGISGHIQAITGVGRIETNLPIKTSVEDNLSGVGNKLNGVLGDAAEETRTIDVYTETGKINLE